MLVFNLTSSFFIYAFSLARINYWKSLLVLPAAGIFIYFFGVLGTIRVSAEVKENYNPNLFLDIGRATDQYRDSAIPKEFFWAYIYLSSPLANLQLNINQAAPDDSGKKVLGFITNEFLFDFISKRTNALFHFQVPADKRIEGPFNVSTVYSKSYSYYGWTGLCLMAIFILGLPIAYRKMLRVKNDYSFTGMAILCTVYLFLLFDNTIRFTGLGFQLVFPVLLPQLDKLNPIFFKK
jgi:hypothetical protein